MHLLRTVVCLATVFSGFGAFATADERPNVLFIMSDDHTTQAIGAYGSRLAGLNPTPNIDTLAREGMLLTNVFCGNSICTPSRATIMTGQHSHVNGVTTLNGSLEPKQQTLANLMKQAGYQTAMVGKWHLKKEPAFDYYCVLPGQGSYFNPIFRDKRTKGVWPNNVRRFAGYDSKHSTDVITDLSLRWLKNRKGNKKPFFLMHHYKAPHDNFENAERYDWLYQDVSIPEPQSMRERENHGPQGKDLFGTSISKRNERRNMGHHMFVDRSLPNDQYTGEAYQRYLKKYLRCVKGVDDGVGRVLAYLKETGELDNTIIMYTGDQGFMLGEHDYIDKRWMYEESLRMPLLVRYPKHIEAGSKSDAIINNTDFAPTMLDFAGAEVPESMQGRSLKPVLAGNTPGDWREASYYRYWMHMAHHDNPAHYGIRTKTAKLIFFYGLPCGAAGAKQEPTQPHWELYDLAKDPREMNNVFGKPEYAALQKQMLEMLDRKKQQVGDTDEDFPELLKAKEQSLAGVR